MNWSNQDQFINITSKLTENKIFFFADLRVLLSQNKITICHIIFIFFVSVLFCRQYSLTLCSRETKKSFHVLNCLSNLGSTGREGGVAVIDRQSITGLTYKDKQLLFLKFNTYGQFRIHI